MGAAGLAREAQPWARPRTALAASRLAAEEPREARGVKPRGVPSPGSGHPIDELGRGLGKNRTGDEGVHADLGLASFPGHGQVPTTLVLGGWRSNGLQGNCVLPCQTGDFTSCPGRRRLGAGGRSFQVAVIVSGREDCCSQGSPAWLCSETRAHLPLGSVRSSPAPTWSAAAPYPHAFHRPWLWGLGPVFDPEKWMG